MCNTKVEVWLFPMTCWMCDEADDYCISYTTPRYTSGTCCGPRDRPCCIDCYYCLSPIVCVLDILCFPRNLYYKCIFNNEAHVAAAI